MLLKGGIAEYYKTAELVLKPDTQWRLYKMQLYDGRWVTIRNQIRNPEQLRQILIKETPLNVFSSCSAWLNPLNVEKHSYRYADRIFLSNLVFIDIDEHNPKIFNEVVEFFESRPRYMLWRAKDSGNGYGLYYIDLYKIVEPNPIRRMELVVAERMKLVAEMLYAGIRFDWRMLIDPYRISRVIGTLNEGEKICKEIHDLLPERGESLERLEKADEIATPRQNDQKSVPTGLSTSSSHYYYVFIDSMIYGIKDKHCVHIMKRKEYGYDKFIRLLEKVQSVYRLSDFYAFETKKYYVGLCAKGIDAIRFKKILRKAKATNLNSFIKYRHSWIRTSNVVGNQKDEIEPRPKFMETIKNEEYRDHFHSRPHLAYLSKVGVNTEEYPNVFGIMENKQMVAKVKI